MPDGKIPKFRIQCITEDMFDEVLDMMCNIFARDELTCSRVKLEEDPVSLDEFKKYWLKYLKQKIGLVAIIDEEGKREGKRPRIAGLNLTGVTLKSDKVTLDMVSELL